MGDPLLPGPSPLLTQHRHTFHKLSQTCSRVTIVTLKWLKSENLKDSSATRIPPVLETLKGGEDSGHSWVRKEVLPDPMLAPVTHCPEVGLRGQVRWPFGSDVQRGVTWMPAELWDTP